MENLDLGINLGFGSNESVDNLIEKLNSLEGIISKVNEVSENDIFSNLTNSFKNLSDELKIVKEEVYNLNDKNKKEKTDSKKTTNNDVKKDTFDLSQSIKNLENIAKSIYNNQVENKITKKTTNNSSQHKPEETEFTKAYNRDMEAYYNKVLNRPYRDKKFVNDKVTFEMSDRQFNFLKRSTGIDFDRKTVEVNSKKEQDKMLENTLFKKFIEQLENLNKYNHFDESHFNKLINSFRNTANGLGFNGDLFKNNSNFKKIRNITKDDINKKSLTDLINQLKANNIPVRKVNYSDVSKIEQRKYEKELRDLKNDFDRFKVKNPNKNYDDYLERKYTLKKQKENYQNNFATSLQDNLNKNIVMSSVIGLSAFSQQIGHMFNFMFTKEFEKNIGALGIVGNIPVRNEENIKRDIINTANGLGQDANEFALAVREVIKTGKSYEQSLKLVSSASKMAVASFEDLTTATDIINARFTALNLPATDNILKDFTDRLQSALDNTALDLKDVTNAGRYSNGAMNAVIESANERGTLPKGKSIEDYTMDISNLELSIIGQLKQQGKTGEQAGTMFRTMFTKLMSLDGQGAKRLDADLSKLSDKQKAEIGFSSAKELSSMFQNGQVFEALQGMSKFQKMGELSYGTTKKIMTERYASAFNTLLYDIDGNLDKFIDKITTGKDNLENFNRASKNWAVSLDMLAKNFKNLSTLTFNTGINQLGLGGVITALNGGAKGINYLASNDDVGLKTVGQSLPQIASDYLMLKSGIGFVNNRFYKKNETLYKAGNEFIERLNPQDEKLKTLLQNQIKDKYEENLLNTGLINNAKTKIGLVTKSDYALTKKMNEELQQTVTNYKNIGSEVVETATATTTLANSVGLLAKIKTGLLAIGKFVITKIPIIAGVTAVILSVNYLINAYKKAKKEQQDFLDESEKIKDLNKYLSQGRDEFSIYRAQYSKALDLNNVTKDYLSNIKEMISKNEELANSLNNIKAFNKFKFSFLDDLKKEQQDRLNKSNAYFKAMNAGKPEKDKNSLDTVAVKDLAQVQDEEVKKYRKQFEKEIIENRNRNVNYSYKTSNGVTITDNYGKLFNNVLDNSNKNPNYPTTYSKDNKNNFSKKEEDELAKKIDGLKQSIANRQSSARKLVDDIEKRTKKEYEEKTKGKKFDALDESTKKLAVYNNFTLDNKNLKALFGNQLKSLQANGKLDSKGNLIGGIESLVNSYGTKENSVYEKANMMLKDMSNKGLDSKSLEYFRGALDNYVKKQDELNKKLYNQYNSYSEFITNIQNGLLNPIKNKINAVAKQNGFGYTVTGNVLNTNDFPNVDKKVVEGKNSEFRNKLNNIDSTFIRNNPESVDAYSEELTVLYEAEMSATQKLWELKDLRNKKYKTASDEEKKFLDTSIKNTENILKNIQDSIKDSDKLFYLNQLIKTNIKDIYNSLSQIGQIQNTINNLVGTSFGNKGSDLKLRFENLNTQMSYFNKYGDTELKTQLMAIKGIDTNNVLGNILGKSDYSSLNVNDAEKLFKVSEDMRKQGKKEIEVNGKKITDTDLGNMYQASLSVMKAQLDMEQQKLQYSQQQKQIQIDIVKYWLNENKLKANPTEDPDKHVNRFLLNNVDTVRKATSGDNGLFRMNDLQTITNLKLDNSNMKMGEQLDYARRSLIVARENAQRQINAIRRLEQKNTSNANKTDMLNKVNTVSTNNTVATGVNTLSENLNAMFEQLSGVLSSMSFGGGMEDTIEGTGNPSASAQEKYRKYKPIFDEAERRTGISSKFLAGVSLQESGMSPNEKASTSSATGFMQIRPRDWGDMYKWGKKYGVRASNGVYDPAQSVLAVASRFAHNRDTGYYKRLGISNPTELDFYMTHMLGEHGYEVLMKHLNQPTANYLPDSANANKSIFYNKNGKARTGQEIRMFMKGKLEQRYGELGFGKGSVGTSSSKSSKSYSSGGMTDDYSGLRFKNKKENTGGGKVTQSTLDFARVTQNNLPDFKEFTAMNDVFHIKNVPTSGHTKGVKFDFTITTGKAGSNKAVNNLKQLAKQRNFDIKVLNEYTNPSSNATGGHIDVKVLSGSDTSSSFGGGASLTYKKPNLKMMRTSSESYSLNGGYMPTFDKGTLDEIQKIYHNDFEKDMVKTEVEENAIKNMMQHLKEWEGLPIPLIQRNLQQLIDDTTAVTKEDLSIFKDLARGIQDRLQEQLDSAKESYDKALNQFIDNVNNLHFAFEELQEKVKQTSRDWERGFAIVNASEIGDTLLQSFNMINETNAKINSKYKKLVMDIKINPNLTSVLDYLNTYNGAGLNTDKQKFDYLTSNDKMLNTMRYFEDRMYELAKNEFKALGLDKTTLHSMSDEEKNKFLAQVYTEIAKKGNTDSKMFENAQTFDNTFTMYKLLGQRIEDNIEVKKQETDIMKNFNKVFIDFTTKIKNFSNQMFNLDNLRSLDTAINNYTMSINNINSDSPYGKKVVSRQNYINNMSLLDEYQQQIKTMLSTDSQARRILAFRRYTDEDIDNMNIKDPSQLLELANELKQYTLIQNRELKAMFNDFIENNQLVNYFKGLDITNPAEMKKVKEDLLQNKDAIDPIVLNNTLALLDVMENNTSKVDELNQIITKAINTTKDLNEGFTQGLKHFTKETSSILSDFLFGTESEWKGFDYKQTLTNMLELGVSNRDNILNWLDKRLEKLGIDIIKDKPQRTLRDKDSIFIDSTLPMGGDIRGVYLNSIKNSNILDEGKLNIALNENGSIYSTKLATIDEQNKASLKELLFNGYTIDDKGSLSYLKGNSVLTVDIVKTEGKEEYKLIKPDASDAEDALIVANSLEDLRKQLQEHNKKEWETNNLDNKKITSYVGYSYVDSLIDANRQGDKISKQSVNRLDLLTDDELDDYTQKMKAESEINLRKYKSTINDITAKNLVNKKENEENLKFATNLYKDLGTKPINLTKDSPDYFPFKVNSKDGTVFRIDSAEYKERDVKVKNNIKISPLEKGNRTVSIIDEEGKSQDIGKLLEVTKSKKNKTSDLYIIYKDGKKKERILKNFKVNKDNTLDDATLAKTYSGLQKLAKASEIDIDVSTINKEKDGLSFTKTVKKKGTDFSQTPVYDLYRAQPIKDGKPMTYTNFDTYENAIKYATSQNIDAITNKMNKFVTRTYDEMARQKYDKFNTLKRDYNKYEESLTGSYNLRNNVNNYIEERKPPKTLKGVESLATPININTINTKGFDASKVAKFTGKGLKGNEQFFADMANNTGYPVEWLIAIAQSESGLDPKNNNGKYFGLFQFGPDYWTDKKAKEVSKKYNVKIDSFNKGRYDPLQNTLMMINRMDELVELSKKQGATTFSSATGYMAQMLPYYAQRMNNVSDDVKIIDFDNKEKKVIIKDSYLLDNPRNFTSGVNTTNGEAKASTVKTLQDKLKEAGFVDSEFFKNYEPTHIDTSTLNSAISKEEIKDKANKTLLNYDNTLKNNILDINDKYLSASAEISDYGDPTVRQFAKDTVNGTSTSNNSQPTTDTVNNQQTNDYRQKIITLFQGHEDSGAVANGYSETEQAIRITGALKEVLLELFGGKQLKVYEYRRKGAIGSEFAEYDKNTDLGFAIHLDDAGENNNKMLLVGDPNNEKEKTLAKNIFDAYQGKNFFTNVDGKEFSVGYGKSNAGVLNKNWRPDKNAFMGFAIARKADEIAGKDIPFALLEFANVRNKKLMDMLQDPKKLKEAVTPLALGIGKTLGLKPKEEFEKGLNSQSEKPEVIYVKNQSLTDNYELYSNEYNNRLLQAQLNNSEENLTEKQKKDEKNQKRLNSFIYGSDWFIILDGMLKRELSYKKKHLEIEQKVLEMNLQMAETTKERRAIEEEILRTKLAQIDNDYENKSSVIGGMISGTAGFGLQGMLQGAIQGSSFGMIGSVVGAGLGLVSGLGGGMQAKIQAEQQKSLQVSQQKLQWLAEDRNRYLKTMANAMSEQAKWTTKIGVTDAINRSIRFAVSNIDTLGGTSSATKTVEKKKKKGGGLLGSKKYDTVKTYTASYNTNDPMFGGRTFDDVTDLNFAYGVLARRILGDKLDMTSEEIQNSINNGGKPTSKEALKLIYESFGLKNIDTNRLLTMNSEFSGASKLDPNNINKYRRNKKNIKYGIVPTQQENQQPRGETLGQYLERRIAGASIELTAGQFLSAWNGQSTLRGMGLLQDTSRDGEIASFVSSLKDQYNKMGASQKKVDMLALINFYENIQALLDKEGKTTKRLFGNYYGIETEEVKDEKGNVTEYKRVNESMWSDFYQQISQNIMNGSNQYNVGTKFITGTVNAFIQNVSSSRGSVKAITDEFNRLADEIYNVVTRTGEFTNVSGTIQSLINDMAILRQQQKETENFTIELAKKWVALGGNITDVVKDMNNGLSLTLENIKSNMLGKSLEDTINNFGSNIFQKLGESITTNLVNKKYADSIFNMNSMLTTASDTNSISDIVALANGYKGLSVKIENDRERLNAIQRLFTANRDIDYVDESIQYETGTSQSVTNNYTFTTDINAGTIVADELSKEILAQNLFAPLVQMLKDAGFIH